MACGGGDDDDVDIVARFQRSLPCGASVRNLKRVSKSGRSENGIRIGIRLGIRLWKKIPIRIPDPKSN